ncbi:lipase [Pseudomonas fluorescens]|uniref:Lipase n=1 Tax=Pseudomonas fluorescens TaxID=294 RepID=A0A379IDP6_PSEFL|nr:polyurethanase [Pseudomonas fluorescens]AIG01657.1 polyurethanase [Pseudomonas fluorescens]SUD30851.1 lipase [Pseudomonas fluorescens]
MGVFNYKSMTGEDAKALLNDALALSEYAYDSTGQPLAIGGWAPIGAQALGVTQKVDKQGTFWGETALAPSANVEILGQYDGVGKLIAMGIAFRGTSFALTLDGLGDVASDLAAAALPGYAANYAKFAFSALLENVASYATSQGLTGKNILVTGHSLGALGANSLATLSRDNWGGFYQDANYVTFASPTQRSSDTQILNIGYENDPVFKAIDGKGINTSALFWGNDKVWDSATNNLVSFTDNYASFPANLPNSLNWGVAKAHSLDGYIKGLERIASSDFYDLTSKDSTIVVSSLTEATRETTWVQDLNRYAEKHIGNTFIIGTEGNDLLKGGVGNDFLEGGSGNDRFRDDGGYNIILGGQGDNVLELQKPLNSFAFANDGDGTLYISDAYGSISMTRDIGALVSKEASYIPWTSIPWGSYEITYQVVDNGLLAGTELTQYASSAKGDADDNALIARAAGDWLFGLGGDDHLIGGQGNDVFVGGTGNDLMVSGGGNNTFLFNGFFGNDRIEGYQASDKLVFMGMPDLSQDYDYRSYVSTVEDSTVLSFGDNSVMLVGVDMTQLNGGGIFIS